MGKIQESTFVHKGLRCSVMLFEAFDMGCAVFGQSWRCGYVEVPEGHPYFRCDYDDAPDGRPDLPSPEDRLEVHGGVTYANKSKNGWEFGFDCCHYGDSPEEWTRERVEEECRKLADQLIEIV